MNLARFYAGTILLTLGVLLILGETEVIDAGEAISQWWPVAILAGALLTFASNPRHWLGPLVIGSIGVIVLLNTTETLDEETMPMAWAIVLLLAGVAVLAGSLIRPAASRHSADRIQAFAAFGERKVVSHSKHFEGGSMGAVFGGAELDLRDAELAPDARIDVFTAFGGAEIRVPLGWRVETHGMPWFGGFDNVAEGEGEEGSPTLDINATVLFGGLEVKH